MPQKKPFQFVNMKPSLKKIEKDIHEIGQAVGIAQADMVNLAHVIIPREHIINGVPYTERTKKGQLQYKAVPGANRARKPQKNKKENPKVFHKSKLIERSGNSMSAIFNKLNFKKFGIGSNKIAEAQDGDIKVSIFKRSGKIMTVYSMTGEMGRKFGILDGGSKTERITDSKGNIKNVKGGQRRVVRQGLSKALRRWDKLNKFYIERAIKKRNLEKL